jgi:Predicted membrane protein
MLWFLMVVFLLVLGWSAYQPYDLATWALEVSPAIIGAIILLVSYRRFELSGLLYGLIFLHAIVLVVGGHYTYAKVPYFDGFLQFIWPDRNNYDKLGHFMQGLVPAILCRELVIRFNVFNSRAWMNFFIVCFCLGFSAFYELIEWWVALLSDEASESFLGTQGYVWDTQSDMFLALIGAVLALLVFSRWHDKQLSD